MDETGLSTEKSFHRLVFLTRDDLLAARWWHEGMEQTVGSTPSRRSALKVILGMGGMVGLGLVFSRACGDDDPAISYDALELQRRQGWSVGSPNNTIVIPNQVATNSAGLYVGYENYDSLGDDLSPGRSTFEPFFVRTLFEALSHPFAVGLKLVLRPMHSESMDVAEKAARGLAAMFANEDDRKHTALILDLPGPESVAAAAGLAKIFAPVFLYDNWPHPMGVVPSHTTLAAAIYHKPDFVAAKLDRVENPAPAFVLDRNRLSPYRDESDRFDNRYVAKLPSADALWDLGVRRVLYVTQVALPQEMDDLNDDFVAFREKAIDVKMIALTDFTPASRELLATNPEAQPTRYYYGGHPLGYAFFWSSYHWSSPSLPQRAPVGGLPRTVSGGGGFSPVPRPTLFSSRNVGGLAGVGKQKPSGFGRVSYRSSSNSFGSSRSGSFGRSRSGSSG